ncbi:MAG: hypothetical protein SPK70_05745 [Succinivibrio dextrinosolvens]|nr:hypothetical protein [Succinivibrio dextrinosolvens]MDY6470550.1 hypothetical protein [Succinivibrio dextrinosolvens]
MNKTDIEHFANVLKEKIKNTPQYFSFYHNNAGVGNDYIQVLPTLFKGKKINSLLTLMRADFHFEFFVSNNNVYCDIHVRMPYDAIFQSNFSSEEGYIFNLIRKNDSDDSKEIAFYDASRHEVAIEKEDFESTCEKAIENMMSLMMKAENQVRFMVECELQEWLKTIQKKQWP